MATTNERLQDAETLHAVRLQRYGNFVVRRMLRILNLADADLFTALQRALESSSVLTVERLESLLHSVRQLNFEAYKSVERELTTELKAFTAQETTFQHRLF